jgi:hypothetical protein
MTNYDQADQASIFRQFETSTMKAWYFMGPDPTSSKVLLFFGPAHQTL